MSFVPVVHFAEWALVQHTQGYFILYYVQILDVWYYGEQTEHLSRSLLLHGGQND